MWKIPFFLSCEQSPEWSAIKKSLRGRLLKTFDYDILKRAQALLVKYERAFVSLQNTDFFYVSCTEEQTGNLDVIHKFNFAGLPPEEGFCYYGYLTAAAYQARLGCAEDEECHTSVKMGSDNLEALLHKVLMSASVDFLHASGWPMSVTDLVYILYADKDLTVAQPVFYPEDTKLPPETVSVPSVKNVGVVGFHATLALEIVELWKYVFPGSNYDVQILEERRAEGAGESLCQMMDACATDLRFQQLFDEHVETKVKLPKSGYPNPSITDLNAFMTAFVQMFGGSLGAFERGKEIFVCTEPAVMCWALREAFPDHPIVGYFGNPLLTYLGLQKETVHLQWLQTFHHLSNFIPVASTRFLAEQMRYQASRPVGAVRPLALYLDAAYQPPVTATLEFLVLRQPFVFWDSGCVLNSFAQLNGIPVTFVYSDYVKPARSYRAWSQWHGLIFLPYDASQMRFYEFYAMGMPIFLPRADTLPSFIYRGVTAVKDFDTSLDSPVKDLMPNPFAGHKDWPTACFWTRYTHYVQLPGLLYFSSYVDLFSSIQKIVEDPEIAMQTSLMMRKEGIRGLLDAANFWRTAIHQTLGNAG